MCGLSPASFALNVSKTCCEKQRSGYICHVSHPTCEQREERERNVAARGWPAEVYWACIEVQFATAPPGIAAEVAAMDVLAQLRGSCTSAFLQVGAGRAMQWTQGERRWCTPAPARNRCHAKPCLQVTSFAGRSLLINISVIRIRTQYGLLILSYAGDISMDHLPNLPS